MKTKPETASPSDDTILIGSVRFIKQLPPKVRGGPRCVLSSNAKKRGELRFNAAQLEEMPGFAQIDRIAVFVAVDKPAIFITAGDGVKVREERSGARKATGTPFRGLATKYQRIMYRVEQVESPRKGWLLSPTESEPRKA